MALQFDPASILAPGGIAQGLGDLGSSVVQALSRRAERQYGLEREQRGRANQLSDRQQTRDWGLMDETRHREQTLTDESRKRNYQWWLEAAKAGPEEWPEYTGLSPEEVDQLESIRIGVIAARNARGAGQGGYPEPSITPPATTETVKRQDTDRTSPTHGKTFVETVEVPFDARVETAAESARKIAASPSKARAGQIKAEEDYAATGQRAKALKDLSRPWLPDGDSIHTGAAAARAAFERSGNFSAGEHLKALTGSSAFAGAAPAEEAAPEEDNAPPEWLPNQWQEAQDPGGTDPGMLTPRFVPPQWQQSAAWEEAPAEEAPAPAPAPAAAAPAPAPAAAAPAPAAAAAPVKPDELVQSLQSGAGSRLPPEIKGRALKMLADGMDPTKVRDWIATTVKR